MSVLKRSYTTAESYRNKRPYYRFMGDCGPSERGVSETARGAGEGKTLSLEIRNCSNGRVGKHDSYLRSI
jgi:hypothetical protein